jgi:hypothetical protein
MSAERASRMLVVLASAPVVLALLTQNWPGLRGARRSAKQRSGHATRILSMRSYVFAPERPSTSLTWPTEARVLREYVRRVRARSDARCLATIVSKTLMMSLSLVFLPKPPMTSVSAIHCDEGGAAEGPRLYGEGGPTPVEAVDAAEEKFPPAPHSPLGLFSNARIRSPKAWIWFSALLVRTSAFS